MFVRFCEYSSPLKKKVLRIRGNFRIFVADEKSSRRFRFKFCRFTIIQNKTTYLSWCLKSFLRLVQIKIMCNPFLLSDSLYFASQSAACIFTKDNLIKGRVMAGSTSLGLERQTLSRRWVLSSLDPDRGSGGFQRTWPSHTQTEADVT